MLREELGNAGRNAIRAALVAVVVLVPAGAEAGLKFVPDTGDLAAVGGDVRALVVSGGTYWAGTRSGVFRGTSPFEAWALDGLSGRSVASLAVLGDEVWAATGEELWHRSSDGAWSLEALPGGVTVPATVAVDASGALWAGGLGIWRRVGGAWSAAPSPGAGIVLSMLPDAGGLVVGLSTGSVAQWNGSGWTVYAGGVGSGESVRALASSGGALWAGTSLALYTWTGGTWVADSSFGRHDVRALTTWGGVLRAGTADAGVLVRSGSSWAPDGAGILPRGAQSFLATGSDLLAGTAGGGVYLRQSTAWTQAPGPMPAAVVTDVVQLDPGHVGSWAAASTAGGGAAFAYEPAGGPSGGQAPLARLPDGCGDATAIARTAGASPEVLVATACGPFVVSRSAAVPGSGGLSTGATPTTLAAHGGTIYGGTAGCGLWRWSGSSWSPETVVANVGTDCVGGSAVRAIRSFGGTLWAALAEGLFARGTGTWTDVSAGLPPTGLVASLGGDASATFAGLSSGGVYRRFAGGDFVKDAAGLNSASVRSLEVSGGRLWAAAGTRGLALKTGGAWQPETGGLPPGASVAVVRDMGRDPSNAEWLLVGTAGHGAYRAFSRPTVKSLPVVLDVYGSGGAHFLSELVVGSRATADSTHLITFTPAPGFTGPGGTTAPLRASVTLPAGRELRSVDALAFLRSLGMPIPLATPDAPVAGSVTLGDGSSSVDDHYLIARTYTPSASGGTFGLFYGAPSDLDAAEDVATVYGLRSVAGEARSNLAVVHLPGRGRDPIEVSVQVYTASGSPAGDPLVRTLAPGEWTQWNGVLGLAGLPDGSYGYARIRRTSGAGAFAAYGVVNDAKTSDGSFLPAFRPGGLAAARIVIVPVVLDVFGEAGSHYTTEVTLANDGSIATPVDLVYRSAPGFGEVGGVPLVTVDLAARQQVTIPDVLAYLRAHGVSIPDGQTAPQAGTLTVTFRWLTELDAPSTVVLARTSTPNTDAATGGTFGLFYPGAAKGGGARTAALVPGLAQDDGVRSNLAVVNLGGGSELPITLEARLYDADSGAAVGNPLSVRLSPGDWVQWSRVHDLAGAPASVRRFTAVVRRTSGDDTFLAYGVLNDAVTSDGSFQTMITSDPY